MDGLGGRDGRAGEEREPTERIIGRKKAIATEFAEKDRGLTGIRKYILHLHPSLKSSYSVARLGAEVKTSKPLGLFVH